MVQKKTEKDNKGWVGGTIKTISKTVDLNSTATLMTLSVNVINIPIKGQRLSGWRGGKSRLTVVSSRTFSTPGIFRVCAALRNLGRQYLGCLWSPSSLQPFSWSWVRNQPGARNWENRSSASLLLRAGIIQNFFPLYQ